MENISADWDLATDAVAQIRSQAAGDLDDIAQYLPRNDAGGRAILRRRGEAFFLQALTTAHARILQAGSEAECTAIIAYYLREWRCSQLYVAETTNTGESGSTSFGEHELPSLRTLSARTLYLRLPDFSESSRQPILDLLRAHSTHIRNRPNWIIDVRGNGGEMDLCYYPLLAYLLGNDLASCGEEILSTPDNLKNQQQRFQQVGRTLPEPDHNWQHMLDEMAHTPENTYFLEPGQKAFDFIHARNYANYSLFPDEQPPRRVAVLIDAGCASACERFLLKLRQSYNTKLVGQPTFGEVDYAYLTPHLLPSGTRTLYYTVARSLRAQAFEIDPEGVTPDVYVPTSFTQANSGLYLQKVWNWLESGRF